MSDSYLRLRNIRFRGPKAEAEFDFQSGVNVICGASDTGKSFLADSVDFMLGGSALKEIPERAKYDQLKLSLAAIGDEDFKLQSSMSDGNFGPIAVLCRSVNRIYCAKCHRPCTARQGNARHDPEWMKMNGRILPRCGAYCVDRQPKCNFDGRERTVSP